MWSINSNVSSWISGIEILKSKFSIQKLQLVAYMNASQFVFPASILYQFYINCIFWLPQIKCLYVYVLWWYLVIVDKMVHIFIHRKKISLLKLLSISFTFAFMNFFIILYLCNEKKKQFHSFLISRAVHTFLLFTFMVSLLCPLSFTHNF